MITDHAVERYIQRIKGNPTDVGELERLKYYKELSILISNSKLLYNGDFYTQGVKSTTYYLNNNIILVFENDILITLWKLEKSNNALLKSINIMRGDLNRFIKQKKDLVIKAKEIKAVIAYATSNGIEEIDSLITTEMAICELSYDLRLKIGALELIIAAELHNFIYSNMLKKKVKPIEFFIEQQKCYNENRINLLCEGIKLLKKEGFINDKI